MEVVKENELLTNNWNFEYRYNWSNNLNISKNSFREIILKEQKIFVSIIIEQIVCDSPQVTPKNKQKICFKR